MGDLSPVLEAFFQGQQGQARILDQATQIANAKMEREQRQQQLDEIVRQHTAEQQQFEKRLALDQQIHQLAASREWMDTRDKFRQGVMDGSIPLQQTAVPTVNIPGIPSTSVQLGDGQPANVGLPAVPAINIPGGLVNNPVQTMDTPYGKITIATPTQTASQQKISDAVAQAKALLPVDVDKAKQVFAATKEPMYEMQSQWKDAQLAQKQAQMDQQRQEFQDKLQQANTLFQLGLSSKQQRESAEDAYKTAARYNFRTAEQYRSDLADNAHKIALGQLKLSDLKGQEKVDTQSVLNANKLSEPTKGSIDAATTLGDLAARFHNLIPTLQQFTANNNTRTGQVANAIRDLPGINLVSNASRFNGLIQGVLPSEELAQGLSLSRAGSSVPFANAQKTILPNFVNDPKTVADKANDVMDIYLTGASNKLSSLSSEHRKLIFTKILDDHPELLDNPVVGPKLLKAKISGVYKPGGN